MRDRNTGDPRGFAFVVFTDNATVDLIMENTHEINHKIVDVKRAQARGIAPPSIHNPSPDKSPQTAPSNTSGPNEQNQDNLTPEQKLNKVFVGGIPPHVDKDGLKALLEPFGPVTDAIVMIDQATQRSRCFGFVTFADGSGGAHKAVAAQPLQVDGRRVEIKLATPRGETNAPPRKNNMLPPASHNVGLRAGVSATTKGPYAGLAVAYGRNGWKAGYGSFAFGTAGWAVDSWEDASPPPQKYGFSFRNLRHGSSQKVKEEDGPPNKRARH